MAPAVRGIYFFLWVVALVLPRLSQAQVPGITWAQGGGVVGASYRQQAQGAGIATDAAGNAYVTGYFRDTLTLGSTRLISVGDYDTYVAKLDAAGNYQWAVQAGGRGWDIARGIGLDAAGNVYVTGYTESHTATFGSFTLTNPSYGGCLFVAKLSPTGGWLRLSSAAGERDTYTIGTALAVDAAGAVYVTGSSRGSIPFGSATLYCGVYGVFVAKLATNGTWEWVTAGSAGYDFGLALALDGAGNVYVTGASETNVATFGPFTLNNAGSSDVFVAKLSATGHWLWATRGGSYADDGGSDIVLDASGNIFVAGLTGSENPRFGSVSVTKPDDSSDLFVAKLDPAGTWQWVTTGGGPGRDIARGLVLHPSGNLTVAGTAGGATASFGNFPPLQIAGKQDAVVAQLDAAGHWRWALRAGGPGDEYVSGLAAGPQEDARLIGSFDGASTTFGSTTLTGGAAYYTYFADCQFVASVAELARNSPAELTLWPNPSAGTVWATGLDAGQPVQVFDSVGHLLAADARPAHESQGLQLPPLSAGLYVVRCGTQSRKLVITSSY